MEIKNKIKEYLPYLGVVIAIILPWFFHSGYLFFTDMVWGPNVNFDWTSNQFLINIIRKILSFVFSIAFLEKMYIGFTVLIILLGGRKIASYFVEDKFTVFILSLFALFNPFVYDRMMYGQVGIALAFGFFLFATSYLLKYLDNKNGKSMVCFGIFSGLVLQFSAHFIFFIGIIFLLFLILYFKKWKLIEYKNFVKYIFMAGLLCILFNSNWIAGDFLGKTTKLNFVESGITNQDLLAFKTSGSSDSQVLSNVFMMSGFWGKDQHRYIDLTTIKTIWGRSFFFLLFIILLGLIVGIWKKETRFLSLGLSAILLISVVLASGIGVSYFQNITYWMFEHIPFYKGLREPQKWVSVIVLVYLVFLSIGTKALLFETEIFSKYKKLLLTFIGSVIIMQAPFLLFGFYGQASPTSYPGDWRAVNEDLKCKGDEKILFLPWHLYMSFSWVGKIIVSPAKVFFTCPVIYSTAMEWGGIYDNSGNTDSKKVEKWLKTGGRTSLLQNNELGIKYIVLAKEVDWKDYLWIEKIYGIKLKTETATLKIYETR